jgi:colicin import membrane protein
VNGVVPVGEWPASRVGPLARSIGLHVAVLAALGAGAWWSGRTRPPPPQALAIEAVVVDAATLRDAAPTRSSPEPAQVLAPRVAVPDPQPKPPPETPTPEPVAERAPMPQAAAVESVARAAGEEAERAAAQRRAGERAAARAAAEKAAVVKEAAAKEAAARAAAERRAAEQAAAEAQLRAAREADLQRQLAAEENANRARASGQAASWAAAVQARIERAWIRPESARAGLDCTVLVNQVPGGEVTGARIKACNGDEAVRQSIEAAVYRASPLPAPPDPALFERTIEVRFRPHD